MKGVLTHRLKDGSLATREVDHDLPLKELRDIIMDILELAEADSGTVILRLECGGKNG